MTRRQENQDDSSPAFFHKKSLGQNFLTSAVVPTWMCDAAALTPTTTVLEIGPGTGALTRELLKRGVTVVAVEADTRAVSVLKETFASEITAGKLHLHHADIKDTPPEALGLATGSFVAVANIPYYLSGFLLRQLLSGKVQPKTLVFLMQKELVARIARDKKESLLSLSVKAFGEPQYVKTVSRGHFLPKPNVDSAILAVKNITNLNFETLAQDFFFEILHLGLGKKRKQLLTNLSLQYDREALTNLFEGLSIEPAIRGEDLPLASWLVLATALHALPQKSST